MTWRNRPAGSGATVGRGRNIMARGAVFAVTVAAGGLFSAGTAYAAITSFAMTPGSGPVGTAVHVSGGGCTPGLLGSPATDFVTVSAVTLGVTLRLPVTSSGAWQGNFTIPADATPALPAPVVVICTSGGLPSLSTIYLPQTFTVTGPSAPPTIPPITLPPVTLPPVPPPVTDIIGGGSSGGGGGGPTPTPPATKAPGQGSRPPATHVPAEPGAAPPPVPGKPAGGSDGGGGSVTIGTGESLATAPATAPRSAGELVALGHTRAGPVARSATLQPVGLDVSASGSGSSAGWIAWALLVAVVLAALGAPAWLRLRRGVQPEEGIGEST